MSTNYEILGSKGWERGVVLGLYDEMQEAMKKLTSTLDRRNISGADDQVLSEASKKWDYISSEAEEIYNRDRDMVEALIKQGGDKMLKTEATPEALQLAQEAQALYEEISKTCEEQIAKLNNMEISDTPTVYDPKAPMTRGMASLILERISNFFDDIDPDTRLEELITEEIFDQDLFDRAFDAEERIRKLEDQHDDEYANLKNDWDYNNFDTVLNKHDTKLVLEAEAAMQEYVRVKAEIDSKLVQARKATALKEKMQKFEEQKAQKAEEVATVTNTERPLTDDENKEEEKDEEEEEMIDEEDIPSNMTYEEFSERLEKLNNDYDLTEDPNSSLSVAFNKWFKESFGKGIADQAENIAIEDLMDEIVDKAQDFVSSPKFIDLTIWATTLSALDDLVDELNDHDSEISESEDKVVYLDDATQLELAENMWARLKRGPKAFAEAEQLNEGKTPKRAKAQKEEKPAPQVKAVKEMTSEEVDAEEASLVERMKQLKSRKQRLNVQKDYEELIQGIFDDAMQAPTSASIQEALRSAKQDIKDVIDQIENIEGLQPEDVAELRDILTEKFNEFAKQMTKKATELLKKEMSDVTIKPATKTIKK